MGYLLVVSRNLSLWPFLSFMLIPPLAPVVAIASGFYFILTDEARIGRTSAALYGLSILNYVCASFCLTAAAKTLLVTVILKVALYASFNIHVQHIENDKDLLE